MNPLYILIVPLWISLFWVWNWIWKNEIIDEIRKNNFQVIGKRVRRKKKLRKKQMNEI